MVEKIPEERLPIVTKGNLKLNEWTHYQFKTVMKKWNVMGANLGKLVNYEKIGEIRNHDIKIVKGWILRNMIMPTGNLLELNKMSLDTPFDYARRENILSKRYAANTENAYSDILDSSISTGNGLVRLDWEFGKRRFNTLAITNVMGIKFDIMLSNIGTIRNNRISSKISMSKVKRKTFDWFWPFKRFERGWATGYVKANCENKNDPCSGEAQGNMSMGKWKSELIPIPPERKGDCCKSVWIWGFATASATIEIEGGIDEGIGYGRINVKIKGLGSGAGGAVTLSDCCSKKKK